MVSNRRFVTIEEGGFEEPQKVAAGEVKSQIKLSLEEGRKKAHELVNIWANRK